MFVVGSAEPEGSVKHGGHCSVHNFISTVMCSKFWQPVTGTKSSVLVTSAALPDLKTEGSVQTWGRTKD